MSNSSPAPASRLARSAQIATIVPAGNSTPRCSIASVQMRAVNGVIGSNLSTSSTAAGTRPGSPASAAHCPGWAANSRMRVRQLGLGGVDPAGDHVEDQVDALLVGQPLALLLGREQRADEVVSRAHGGGCSSSVSTYSYSSPTARSIRAGSLARARMSNCFCTSPTIRAAGARPAAGRPERRRW